MKYLIIILILIISNCVRAEEFFPLDINYAAKSVEECYGITVLHEIRGTVFRFELKNPEAEYHALSLDVYSKIKCIEYFLAKIKNPVIIEVHTNKVPEGMNIRNWEFSSVIAGKIEDAFLCGVPKISSDRIYSIGYGEFMPDINTSNNGGKSSGRVDIIILSSISGE